MKFTLRIGGEERSVRVRRGGERVYVQFDGEEVVELLARRLHDGTYQLRLSDEASDAAGTRRSPMRAVAARLGSGGTRQLWSAGILRPYERFETGVAGSATEAGALSATIPSIVLEVLVEPGAQVEDGQKLLLLESMKMVLPIRAPHAGTVTAINCKPGESVEPGRSLVELERRE